MQCNQWCCQYERDYYVYAQVDFQKVACFLFSMKLTAHTSKEFMWRFLNDLLHFVLQCFILYHYHMGHVIQDLHMTDSDNYWFVSNKHQPTKRKTIKKGRGKRKPHV